MQSRDTIAAIATPPGAGGIGVIRVSGAAVPAMAEVLLGRPPQPRLAHYCRFRDACGEVLDQGLLLYFPAPRSFTGEDVLELHAHGSPVLLALLLQRCLALGARAARPGEFSERAYLNDKLDLAQAEAIADLIASGSAAAARAAMRSLSGEFSARVHALEQQLIELRVYIEAAIDFPEEEIDFLAVPELAERFARCAATLDALQSDAQRGQRLCDGLHIVILGAPNAGKSSLLNALAGTEAAIVAPIAGTTRDLLRERLQLDGLPLTVVDTAGLRVGGDVIEREGMRRASAEAHKADLVLWVCDDSLLAADPNAATLPQDFAGLAALPRLIVHNKIDLSGAPAGRQQRSDGVHVYVSAQTGAGLEDLRREIKASAGIAEHGEGSFSARQRHLDALERTRLALNGARHAALEEKAGELAAEDLRAAHAALGEITGEYLSDELLGAIFSSFCIGK